MKVPELSQTHLALGTAWWAWHRPEQTARALLDAHRADPGEVRDRPAMRSIATELAERHPRIAGVGELQTAVARTN
ncbi:hypothetical protein [Streptomyces sp. NBC_00827]|uniref:hypothetical protein n=1 Tax=Streptomyces sp. NBC_00827 TaxID=2903677 RepID=UPI00386FE11B